MRAPAAVTATGTLLLCAACGGTASTQPARAWRSNAAQLVTQLRSDVASVEAVAPSRSAFGNTDDLYVLLVAYSDLSGCSSMAAATAAPAAEIRILAQPCPQLERASALFTQAEASSDVHVLAQAAHEASLAGPALVRAGVGLRPR